MTTTNDKDDDSNTSISIQPRVKLYNKITLIHATRIANCELKCTCQNRIDWMHSTLQCVSYLFLFQPCKMVFAQLKVFFNYFIFVVLYIKSQVHQYTAFHFIRLLKIIIIITKAKASEKDRSSLTEDSSIWHWNLCMYMLSECEPDFLQMWNKITIVSTTKTKQK